ncbi:MAG: hypothetical protein ABJ246_00830 [Paracoccaceae bacterium]
MQITGTTKVFPIIGDPVSGVVSPPAINAWLKEHEIDARMIPLNIPSTTIGSFWELLRVSETFLGCSVTYPHKQSAFEEADKHTERAARLGALNTLRRERDGTLCGDATDGLALVHAIAEKGVCLKGKSVHIIGAGGGAGRAIIDAFCEAGIVQQSIEDEDKARREETALMVKKFWPSLLISKDRNAKILVDATPNGKIDGAPLLFPDQAIMNSEMVCDIAGVKGSSALLIRAEQMGKITVDATEMGRGQVQAQMNFLFCDV